MYIKNFVTRELLQVLVLVLLSVPNHINAAPAAHSKTNAAISPKLQQHGNAPSVKIDSNAMATAGRSGAKNSTFGTTAAKFHLKWTPRAAWQANPPLHPPTAISGASEGVAAHSAKEAAIGVSHVIIHHTATPADMCQRSANACAAALRAMQRSHQQQRGWDDIGYNFLIGGSDERAEIYEGRGFNVVGAHAVGYNSRSIGVALVGDWTAKLPPRPVLEQLKQLIAFGVEMGFIQRNHKLLGHRQVKATECPGTRLFNELKAWPNFVPQ